MSIENGPLIYSPPVLSVCEYTLGLHLPSSLKENKLNFFFSIIPLKNSFVPLV